MILKEVTDNNRSDNFYMLLKRAQASNKAFENNENKTNETERGRHIIVIIIKKEKILMITIISSRTFVWIRLYLS